MNGNKKKKKKGKGSFSPGGSKRTPGNPSSSAPPATANSSAAASPSNPTASKTKTSTPAFKLLQPEQMSLEAYQHIQECLNDKKVKDLEKGDVTAVMELSQHLRVFGVLSAVGYVRHAREGDKRKRIRPMWTPLLWRLVCGDKQRPSDDKQARQELMNATYTLSTKDPKGYMVRWRQALKLSNHWNFWARACQKEDADEQRTEDGNTAS